MGNTGKLAQFTATFAKLSLKDIKGFRLLKRPYQWIEFRHVSLQPGKKTDVQVSFPAKPSVNAVSESRSDKVIVGNNRPVKPADETKADKDDGGPTLAVNAAADLKALPGQWKVVRVEKGKGADQSWGESCSGGGEAVAIGTRIRQAPIASNLTRETRSRRDP